MKNKTILMNILSSLLLQVVSIVSGLIVPRMILSSFGSDVNGLVSSIGQFLSYISLMEGGITSVIAANLYKPLVENDEVKLSAVLVTAKSFYKKISIIFIGYTVVIGIGYPIIVDTGYDNLYIFVLTLVLSIGLLLQYMFSLTLTTLLNADKKAYVVSLTQAIITVVNIFFVYIVIMLYSDIIILKLVSAILFGLQPAIYGIYVNHNYSIDWNVPKDKGIIKERWNGFAINIAFFIHAGTDITILTLMTDLKTVSVYSVYSLIINKISELVHAIAASIEPTIGQAYAKNDLDELQQKLDLFEYIIFFLVGFLFTITGMLITPFIMIYTSGITDADYYQPLLGALLILAEAIYLLRYPHVSLAYSANKFKEITIPAYVEATINIVVSILFVYKLGLIGVAIGTVAGMAYRTAFHIYYTAKLIPSRGQSIFYRKFLILLLSTMTGVVLCMVIFPIKEFTVIDWLIHAVVYCLAFGIIYSLVSLTFFKKEIGYIKNYLIKK